MSASPPYLDHLAGSHDLVTTYEITRAGFVAAALGKNKLADPFVAEARTLRVKATRARVPQDLLAIADIQSALLTAAGVSNKALVHLRQEDYAKIISEFIQNFLEPAGDKFVEELVYRFLLVRGDTLGGKIRNLAGTWAQRRLIRYIIADLSLAGRPYHWLQGVSGKWRSHIEAPVVDDLRGFSWQVRDQYRVLLFNRKIPLIRNEAEALQGNRGKSVDLCLFDSREEDFADRSLARQIYATPGLYLALGELKGGIDPAGADEHWKTGFSALRRIRSSFSRLNCTPHVFFIGGAIEESMADEIWGLLQSGELTNVANLNDEAQMVSLTRWLCNL